MGQAAQGHRLAPHLPQAKGGLVPLAAERRQVRVREQLDGDLDVGARLLLQPEVEAGEGVLDAAADSLPSDGDAGAMARRELQAAQAQEGGEGVGETTRQAVEPQPQLDGAGGETAAVPEQGVEVGAGEPGHGCIPPARSQALRMTRASSSGAAAWRA